MGYDRGDSFPFVFEPNGNQFGSKTKGKLSPRSYPIQSERKRKYNSLSVRTLEFFSGRLTALVIMGEPNLRAVLQFLRVQYSAGIF